MAAGALATAGFVRAEPSHGLVVHEWGTFTSLQSSDGVPLKWNPLESSRLPKFVYNWNQSGLRRAPTGLLVLGVKSALVTFQRLETPVVYFYSDKEQTVDLSVGFPKGGITEWYPQAPEVGPSSFLPNSTLTTVDAELQRLGFSSSFSLATLLSKGPIKESLIHWPALKIIPAAGHDDLANLLPTDSSGSHYFAARQTDSAYVQAPSFSRTHSQLESEKFLFYRGAGNFVAPLSVSMQPAGAVTVANNGAQPLAHLFVIRVEGGRGGFVELPGLKPGESRNTSLDLTGPGQPLEHLRQELKEQMARSLTAEGLYPREAVAMVNTWDDSWFTEEGVRVLYTLPRAWTDQILPMKIEPKPRELVRVMVGRAELLAPQTENQLTRALENARQGQAGGREEVETMLARLGRFAQPAFERALNRAPMRPAERAPLMALLYDARKNMQP